MTMKTFAEALASTANEVCGCGPYCSCGPNCQCQPGATCSPDCHCGG